MSLIEAEKLVEYTEKKYTRSITPGEIMKFPKVEAIPLNWMLDWAEANMTDKEYKRFFRMVSEWKDL